MAERNTSRERKIGDSARKGEDAARKEEKHLTLHQALEAADIGIWDWDLASNRIVMSANMKKILEVGSHGAPETFEMFLRTILPEDRPRIAEALKKAIRRKSSIDEEFRRRKSDRTIRWMRIRGRVLPGPNGKPERVMGSLHDKTGRKIAYDALASARHRLEEMVKVRTRELLKANERLRLEIALKSDLQTQLMHASEMEQRRIGQDLHDGLSQQLGGIIFMGQVLFNKMEEIGLAEARDMKKLISHLQNALTYARDLAKGLYPTLGKGGLRADLNELAVSVSKLYGVVVTFSCAKAIKTSDETVTIHIYRIVQEALNNAIKHGQATRIDIRLFREKGAVVLTAADNGVGFPEKPNKKGMGLNIMECRASSIGASFNIKTTRTHGTVVTCVFGESSVFGERGRRRGRPARGWKPAGAAG